MTSNSRRRWLSVAALAALLTFLAWLLWPSGKLDAARSLQRELFGPNGQGLSPEQRSEKMKALREATKGLSAEQRNQLRAEGRKKQMERVAKYFKLSGKERTRQLDEDIRRMEKARQQMMQRQGGAGGKTGGQSRGQGQGGSGPSPGDRDRRRQDRLDSSTGAERAMMSQYFRDLNARRQQLGLPTGGGGGPGRMR